MQVLVGVREAILRVVPRRARRLAHLVELLRRLPPLGLQILDRLVVLGLGVARRLGGLGFQFLGLGVGLAAQLLAVGDRFVLLLHRVGLHRIPRVGGFLRDVLPRRLP